VGDAADIDRGRVADGLNDMDVVEKEVHRNGSHDGSDSVACPGEVRVASAISV
jgi:hypothetical protein